MLFLANLVILISPITLSNCYLRNNRVFFTFFRLFKLIGQFKLSSLDKTELELLLNSYIELFLNKFQDNSERVGCSLRDRPISTYGFKGELILSLFKLIGKSKLSSLDKTELELLLNSSIKLFEISLKTILRDWGAHLETVQ